MQKTTSRFVKQKVSISPSNKFYKIATGAAGTGCHSIQQQEKTSWWGVVIQDVWNSNLRWSQWTEATLGEICWVLKIVFCLLVLKVINLCFCRPSVILGVTNPFFAKTLQHWPHIIRIGDMKQAGKHYSFSKLRHTGSQTWPKRCLCPKSVLISCIPYFYRLALHVFSWLCLSSRFSGYQDTTVGNDVLEMEEKY